MYSKFPLKTIGITDNFGMRKHPISGVSTRHYGVDFGWISYKGEPVFASSDSIVVAEGYDSALGNYVVLRFNDGENVIINRYLHLKNRSLVKKGDRVSQGDIIGYMGDTGYSQGVHLHFEYWICPKAYVYKAADVSKYAKDPLKYCYLFDDQKVTVNSSLKVKRVVGNPVFRDAKKNQIKVTKKYLNCRSLPSLKGKVLGYVNLGYYNVLDTKKANGITWYKIANGKWVSHVSGALSTYFLAKADLGKEIYDKDANEVDLNNYNYFISNKDDYYYIFLKKGETIYFPK